MFSFPSSGSKPSGVNKLISRKQIVSAGQFPVNFFVIEGELKGG
jgi:hypothetical protein